MEKKFGENKYVSISTENNSLFWEYKSEATITLKAAEEIIDLLSSMCGKKKYFVFQNMKNLQWIDKSSREYIASHPVTNQMYAWAFYSEQPLHEIMFNIYLTFSKPQVKSAFFKNSAEALEWTKHLKDELL